MRWRALIFLFLALGGARSNAGAKDHPATGWAYVSRQTVEVRGGLSDRRRLVAQLSRGSLVEVYESASKGGASRIRVRAVDLETLESRMGWVDSTQIETFPLDRFPPDAELLTVLGGDYLDDFAKSQLEVARLTRFLVGQGGAEPALVCLIASPALPQARLQMFRRAQGKFVAEAFLEFSFSAMKPGITALEVRDLLGDGNECLVTHEPFDLGLEERGTNLVIRRMRSGQFEKLWEAPLEYRNLASFPPHYRALEPKERNVGAAGTVTRATVDFRALGGLSEPVWKGKVEFHVAGRETPVESVEIEKVCGWDGTKFRALK